MMSLLTSESALAPHALPNVRPTRRSTRSTAQASTASTTTADSTQRAPIAGPSRLAEVVQVNGTAKARGKRKAGEGEAGVVVLAEIANGGTGRQHIKHSPPAKRPLDEDGSPSPPGSPPCVGSGGLPRLLSHLTLAQPFALSPASLSPAQLSSTFPPLAPLNLGPTASSPDNIAFSGSAQPIGSWRPWERPTALRAQSFPPTQPLLATAPVPVRSTSFTELSSGAYKREPSLSPHLVERTKQRKLIHRFFRSESLLAPPTPPLVPVSPASPLMIRRTSLDGIGAGDEKKSAYKPRPKRRLPAWWASVSRSSGDGRPSKLAPAENVWVGDGSSWLPCAKVDDLSTFVVSLPSTPPREAPATLARVPSSDGAEESASSMKAHLLQVLKMRMGGPSKIGEAGLKFKKWVVWNRFSRRQDELDQIGAAHPDGDLLDDDDEDEDDISDEDEDDRQDPAAAQSWEELSVEEQGRLRPYLERAVERIAQGATGPAVEVACEA